MSRCQNEVPLADMLLSRLFINRIPKRPPMQPGFRALAPRAEIRT
jgi:hypothetical protein